MPRALILLAAALIAGVASVAAPLPPRRLIVFASDAAAPALAEQRRLLDGRRADLAERELGVIEVVGNGVTGATETAATLRRRYRVGDGQFRVVLIGKDGGVKRDDTAPVAAQALFDTIDAMPMRAREMRQR